MANLFFRLLLTINSTSLLIIIYATQKGFGLSRLFPSIGILSNIPQLISSASYLAIPALLTWTSIKLSSKLGSDSFQDGEIVSIEHANNSFLPSYLGYFFVALSVENWQTMVFVYGVLFIFTFLSQALYFNPLFLVFGYDFYNAKTKTGTSIFLISRESYKNPASIGKVEAKRINNYTFLETSSE